MHQWNFSFRRCRNHRRRKRRRRRKRNNKKREEGEREKSCEPILFLRIEFQLTHVCACVHCARVRVCMCACLCGVVYVCITAYSQNVYEWVNFKSINRIGCRQNVQWNLPRNFNEKKTQSSTMQTPHQHECKWESHKNARLSIFNNREIDDVKCVLDKGKLRVRTIWLLRLPYYCVRACVHVCVCVSARLSL